MQIPENITKHHGIEAAAAGQVGAAPSVSWTTLTAWHGLETWRPLVTAAMGLTQHTDADVVRVVVATHTILVLRKGDRLIAAVVVTGNPIAKSLQRMLRAALQMARRGRKPAVRAEPAPTAVHTGGGL